mmetsp:Transcript_14925/g.18021  ORF Transcript_14925/g.18021 Transcript_14925/m.18021 type:complete len:123 (-) Transcript_14925:527-895(-)
MGRLFLEYLDGRVYSCVTCKSHLAQVDELISKGFHCKHGKAYLFNTVVNIAVGPREDRLLTTGMHTVADIYCTCCNRVVGWKYEEAFEKNQKYKEGKFILERAKLTDDGDCYSEPLCGSDCE